MTRTSHPTVTGEVASHAQTLGPHTERLRVGMDLSPVPLIHES
jgi:hypothetical protein